MSKEINRREFLASAAKITIGGTLSSLGLSDCSSVPPTEKPTAEPTLTQLPEVTKTTLAEAPTSAPTEAPAQTEATPILDDWIIRETLSIFRSAIDLLSANKVK